MTGSGRQSPRPSDSRGLPHGRATCTGQVEVRRRYMTVPTGGRRPGSPPAIRAPRPGAASAQRRSAQGDRDSPSCVKSPSRSQAPAQSAGSPTVMASAVLLASPTAAPKRSLHSFADASRPGADDRHLWVRTAGRPRMSASQDPHAIPGDATRRESLLLRPRESPHATGHRDKARARGRHRRRPECRSSIARDYATAMERKPITIESRDHRPRLGHFERGPGQSPADGHREVVTPGLRVETSVSPWCLTCGPPTRLARAWKQHDEGVTRSLGQCAASSDAKLAVWPKTHRS